MKAKIKKGAFVGQDFGCYEWPHHMSYDVNQVFEISELDINTKQDRIKLVADGFGMLTNPPGRYGNGALYVKKEDLRMIPDSQSIDFPILSIIDRQLKNGASIEIRDDRVCLIRADGEVLGLGEILCRNF